MVERATPPHSPARYAAVTALFTALQELMDDYRSPPDSEHLTRWSGDAERITGEIARHLAIARARISAAPWHDAQRVRRPRGSRRPDSPMVADAVHATH